MRDEILGRALPVGIEVLRGRVEEREPGAVGRLLPALEHRRVERPAERVRGEVIHAAVAHDRRRRHPVDDALDDRPDALLGGAAPLRRHGADGAREVVQVRAFGVVELQRAGERLQDAVGDAADVAALQSPVVLDAHAGQRRDLLPSQPLHAASAVRRAGRPAPA